MTLRHILTSLAVAITATGMTHARTLTPEEALARINDNSSATKIAGRLSPSGVSLLKTIDTPSGDAAMYVFGKTDDTYMIVSANDQVAPLLGYGTAAADSSVPMPPQMIWWLEGYARGIAYADSVSTSARNHAPAKGDKLRHVQPQRIQNAKRIGPLLSTYWNQDAPFNNTCPTANGINTYTGCVATAMAQVMNYFEYPAKGTGTGYATCYGNNLSMSLDVTFDWGNMLDNYWGSYTTTQANAVANLMKACGFSTNMDYGLEGSGTQSVYVPRALVNNFGYDQTAWVYYRDNYTLDEWQDMLLAQLSDNGPIYYSGASTDGGHAFVCDGYNGNGYFHFNWGWGGAYDGYFLIDALDPAGQGIGGFEGGYNLQQAAVLGVRKPQAGSVKPQAQLTQEEKDLTGDISNNVLTMHGVWYNMGYESASFTLGFELEPVAGGDRTYQSIGSVGVGELNTFYGFRDFSGQLPVCPDGTYRVRVISRTSATAAWMPVLHNLNYTDYVTVQYTGGSASIYTGSGSGGEWSLSNLRLDGELYLNTPASYTITLTNTTGQPQSLTVAPALLSEQNGDLYIIAYAKAVTITVPSGTSKDYTVDFDLTYYNGFETETDYYFCIYDPESMNMYDRLDQMVRVHDEIVPVYECRNLMLEGDIQAIDPANMHLTAEVICTNTDATTRFTVALWDSDLELLGTLESDMFTLLKGVEQTLDIRLQYGSATPDATYYFTVHNDSGELISDILGFKTKGTNSGTDSMTSAYGALEITYDPLSHTATATSGHGMAGMDAYNTAGMKLRGATAIDGEKAETDLEGLSGVVIITATDASGAKATKKVVLK